MKRPSPLPMQISIRYPQFWQSAGIGKISCQLEVSDNGLHLRDIDIELWSKVKAKATPERKTMREVIF
jgi:hypothetical protein